MSDPQKNTDLAAVRSALWARLEGARGRDYWRSLDDLAATPEFQDLLEREFPRQAVGWSEDEDPVEGRRNFLKLMGASLALAGMTACTRQPTEHIMPYVRQPEDLIPGRPLFFATAMTLNGVANGVLVESHEGRPTKMEGNPEHPATLGACDPYSQAAVLQLYDPDRSQALSFNGEISSWSDYTGAPARCAGAAESQERRGHPHPHRDGDVAEYGGAMAHDTEAVSGGQVAPVGSGGAAQRARRGVQAFGQPVNTYYDFSNANVVVSLDADFLASGPASLRYARQFSKRRRVDDANSTMNRLYVVEPMPTPTGTKADHRLALRASDIEEFAWALAISLGIAQGPKTGENHDIYKWLGPIARDLQNNKGAEHRDRGRAAAAHRTRAGGHHEREAGELRQDGVPYRPDRSQPRRSTGVAAGPGEGPGCGRGGRAAHHRRQPGIQCAGGTGHGRPPEESQAADSPRPVRGRDQPGVPVADAGSAFAGNLGRRARVRRDGDHSAAADSAALRRPLGDAAAAIVDRPAGEDALRNCQELLEQPAHGR